MTRSPTVGIAGVGLIGASIGLRATTAGWTVHGWDPSAAHLAAAHERGAISRLHASFAALAADAEVLVLAAPLDATLELLAELTATPPAASLVIDVASVKVPSWVAGAKIAAFVATHPIAGSERSGPEAARADLFAGRIWTYDPRAFPAARERACDFITAMGAEPHPLESAEHDRIVALTSHLPQLLAVVLGAQLASRLSDPKVAALCGTGMRSMLRLGTSSWAVWRAIFTANRKPVAQEVRGLAAVLLTVADELEAEKSDVLGTDFAASARAVALLGANDSATGGPREPENASDER